MTPVIYVCYNGSYNYAPQTHPESPIKAKCGTSQILLPPTAHVMNCLQSKLICIWCYGSNWLWMKSKKRITGKVSIPCTVRNRPCRRQFARIPYLLLNLPYNVYNNTNHAEVKEEVVAKGYILKNIKLAFTVIIELDCSYRDSDDSRKYSQPDRDMAYMHAHAWIHIPWQCTHLWSRLRTLLQSSKPATRCSYLMWQWHCYVC